MKICAIKLQLKDGTVITGHLNTWKPEKGYITLMAAPRVQIRFDDIAFVITSQTYPRWP
jgi:hypothetical protein